jgi:hypothetical protein
MKDHLEIWLSGEQKVLIKCGKIWTQKVQKLGGTAGSKNTIDAEVGSVTGSLSIGMRF